MQMMNEINRLECEDTRISEREIVKDRNGNGRKTRFVQKTAFQYFPTKWKPSQCGSAIEKSAESLAHTYISLKFPNFFIKNSIPTSEQSPQISGIQKIFFVKQNIIQLLKKLIFINES